MKFLSSPMPPSNKYLSSTQLQTEGVWVTSHQLPVRMYQSGQRNMEFFQDEASWAQVAGFHS